MAPERPLFSASGVPVPCSPHTRGRRSGSQRLCPHRSYTRCSGRYWLTPQCCQGLWGRRRTRGSRLGTGCLGKEAGGWWTSKLSPSPSRPAFWGSDPRLTTPSSSPHPTGLRFHWGGFSGWVGLPSCISPGPALPQRPGRGHLEAPPARDSPAKKKTKLYSSLHENQNKMDQILAL